METNPTLHSGDRENYGICCCGLVHPWRIIFWGGALVLIGGSWLLQELGLLPTNWGSFLFPFLLVIYGLGLLLGAARRRR